VSRHPERTEKNCLNCGTEVLGHYCQNCGQQNLVPKETFWHLVNHFINDITHFDGKFFATLKFLLFRPGFLSAEYIRGRRMAYLHPIRMYVFTSAIFFLIFFSMYGGKRDIDFHEDMSSFAKNYHKLDSLERRLAVIKDSAVRADLLDAISDTKTDIKDKGNRIAERMLRKEAFHEDTIGLASVGVRLNLDSLIAQAPKADTSKKEDDSNFGFGGERLPRRISAYDSMERALPPEKRAKGLTLYLNRHMVAINERFRNDPKAFIKDAKEEVLHTFPKILFVSLPLFAAMLRLLNIRKRRRKQFFFVDHGIFTIHLYCATFIMMLILMILQKVGDLEKLGWMAWIETLLFLSVFVYEYVAMKKFYKEGWFKTLVKMFLLNFAAFFVLGILTALFSAWAVMEM
jgi:hypothetical protein